MLARYSSDFVVYRELIENSDDTQSSSFTLEVTCDPSTAKFNCQLINRTNSSNNQRQRNNTLEGIGQIIKNPSGLHTDNSNSPENNHSIIDLSKNSSENCIIAEIYLMMMIGKEL
jgi:hypothetical protein